ncbi:MAG TPA: Ig-like domain-containing protein [Opitutaceae bacterium]|nr:Ig-like domain-containing protein [Opitutaceae bacterium]
MKFSHGSRLTRPHPSITPEEMMNLENPVRLRLRRLTVAFLCAVAPMFAANPPAPQGDAAAPTAAAPGDRNTIVSTAPMRVEAQDGGAFGQLAVAREILSPDTLADLVFTITAEPQHGRVGLSAGGNEADFFKTKTSRLGYFAYRAEEGYTGQDSFAYTVRNETSGLVFQNTVAITVKPPPPIVMDKFEVDASRVRLMNVHEVALATRPNVPVTRKIPNHEDFMSPADRVGIATPKISYHLDEKAKPRNGTATLDPVSGSLTYAPNPGFIGEDRFKYYTVDENNPQLGMENVITVSVEPIRIKKHMAVDRSRSREVDLVFVINNSPSMAAHQDRIAASLHRFRRLFDARDLDYRIGVLTTDFVNADPDLPADEQHFYKKVPSVELDAQGRPVLDRHGRPKRITKHVASNGNLVTLPVMDRPWVTRRTPEGVFEELVKVGTNGDSNRTAFTAVYNFVAGYYNKQNSFLRPDATTFIVFFMDEEETRMATWKPQSDGPPKAEWVENGKLPDLIRKYDDRHPQAHLTLDSYINYWVMRPFIIAKGNQRGKLQIDAVVSSNNISHRRAAELTGGTVLNIDSDFSAQLAALGDRIADTVAVPLDPVGPGATFYEPSLHVLVNGQQVPRDAKNGYTYDELTHSIRFHGAAKKNAFAGKIDITYEEHM